MQLPHLFFWHASYGYAGTLNDKNVLHLSPLLERLIDGYFEKVEEGSRRCAFQCWSRTHDSRKALLVLVDGIYPLFSRFVSYGVLKGRFQLLDRPILLMDLNDMIASRVSTCRVLHNILLVADRIMDGDYRARYDPAASVVLEERSRPRR